MARRVSMARYGVDTVLDVQVDSMHLVENNHQLELYLPTGRDDYQLYLKQNLPKEMMGFLGIKDTLDEALLAEIISIAEPRAIAALLPREGVLDTTGVAFTVISEDSQDSENEVELNTLLSTLAVSQQPSPLLAPQTLPFTPPRSNSRSKDATTSEPHPRMFSGEFTFTFTCTPTRHPLTEPPSPTRTFDIQHGYSGILERVLSHGLRHWIAPSCR